MKKRSYKLAEAQDFEGSDPNGTPEATQELSMEESPPPSETAPEKPVTSAEAEPAPEPRNVIPLHEPSLALGPDTDILSPLEQRVRRLEQAMKAMQETRVTNRPAEPAPSIELPPPPSIELPPQSVVAAPDLALVPALVAPPPQALLAAPESPIEKGPAPLEISRDQPPSRSGSETKQPWMLPEILAEARAIQFMYFDPRYHMSWAGKLLPMLLLAAFMLTSWLPFTKVPGLGWLIEKAAELILGFLLFKVLSHESRRYRQTAPDLPSSLRL